MGKMFNIPQHKLPAKMLANRAVLAAKTGRPGVIAEAIAKRAPKRCWVGFLRRDSRSAG